MNSTRESPLELGQMFLDMRVVALLGNGGSAWVYRVHEPLSGIDYALKLIPCSGGHDEVKQRARKEFLVLREIDHPNVVRVVRAGVTPDGRFIYLQMEHAEGLALREVLEAVGSLTAPEILRLGIQLCEAASAAHSKNIVHRDLKPENVIIGPNNWVKVIDFGVAKLLGAVSQTTDKNHWVGTPLYMTPEQLLGEGATRRSDVYAIGLMMDEAARGHHFVRAACTGKTAGVNHAGWVQITQTPAPLHKVVAGFPRALSLVIQRAMAKDPAERYQTAEELRDALVALESSCGKPLAVLERDLLREAEEIRYPEDSEVEASIPESLWLQTTQKCDVRALFGQTLRNRILSVSFRCKANELWNPRAFFGTTLKSGEVRKRPRFHSATGSRVVRGLSSMAVLIGVGVSGAFATTASSESVSGMRESTLVQASMPAIQSETPAWLGPAHAATEALPQSPAKSAESSAPGSSQLTTVAVNTAAATAPRIVAQTVAVANSALATNAGRQRVGVSRPAAEVRRQKPQVVVPRDWREVVFLSGQQNADRSGQRPRPSLTPSVETRPVRSDSSRSRVASGDVLAKVGSGL